MFHGSRDSNPCCPAIQNPQRFQELVAHSAFTLEPSRSRDPGSQRASRWVGPAFSFEKHARRHLRVAHSRVSSRTGANPWRASSRTTRAAVAVGVNDRLDHARAHGDDARADGHDEVIRQLVIVSVPRIAARGGHTVRNADRKRKDIGRRGGIAEALACHAGLVFLLPGRRRRTGWRRGWRRAPAVRQQELQNRRDHAVSKAIDDANAETGECTAPDRHSLLRGWSLRIATARICGIRACPAEVRITIRPWRNSSSSPPNAATAATARSPCPTPTRSRSPRRHRCSSSGCRWSARSRPSSCSRR